MVTFKLIEKTEDKLVYWYYPEGQEDKRPGVIIVDFKTEEIMITELAEEDWERDIPVEELNIIIESINQMKRERGETDFIEKAAEPEHSIYYGDHAVREIKKYLNYGTIPEKGMQAWY